MNIINEVFSTLEAADLWGVPRDTVIKCCKGQKGLPPASPLQNAGKVEEHGW